MPSKYDQGLEVELPNSGLPSIETRLEILERTLPLVHQLAITDEWESWSAFDKYRLLSPQMREKWGAESLYDSVDVVNALELAIDSFDSTALTEALNLANDSSLDHYIESERLKGMYNEVFGLLNAHLERVSPDTANSTMNCLNENLSIGDGCSLETENRFQMSVRDCIDELDNNKRRDLFIAMCVHDSSIEIIVAFPRCLLKTSQNIQSCMPKIEKEMSSYNDEK